MVPVCCTFISFVKILSINLGQVNDKIVIVITTGMLKKFPYLKISFILFFLLAPIHCPVIEDTATLIELDGVVINISILLATENADIARFSVDKDFFFQNPIDRTEMVFKLMLIPEAFADDTDTLKKATKSYEDIFEYRVNASFKTSQLPR